MDFRDILFVSDYDNTMTGEDHLVPKENLDAIHEFTSKGGAFTLASGRGKREWYESFHHVPFNAPLILSNGATIYDTVSDKILYHAFLTEAQKAQAEKLFLSLPQGCSGLIESEERVYIPKEVYETTGFQGFPGSDPLYLPIKDIPGSWDKVSYVAVPKDPPSGSDSPYAFLFAESSGMDLLELQAKELGVSGIRSLPIMYEIPPEGTDKGTCARKLQKLLGKKVLVCAGDAPNDLAMLNKADYCFIPTDSILEKSGTYPDGALFTVRCEECSIADAIQYLKSL